MLTYEEIVEMARQDYQTAGEIEIAVLWDDVAPKILRRPDGAWVEARVWVSDERFDTEGGQ